MLWDVRSAKGCLRTFDQHNGDTSAGPKSGRSYYSHYCDIMVGRAFAHDPKGCGFESWLVRMCLCHQSSMILYRQMGGDALRLGR